MAVCHRVALAEALLQEEAWNRRWCQWRRCPVVANRIGLSCLFAGSAIQIELVNFGQAVAAQVVAMLIGLVDRFVLVAANPTEWAGNFEQVVAIPTELAANSVRAVAILTELAASSVQAVAIQIELASTAPQVSAPAVANQTA